MKKAAMKLAEMVRFIVSVAAGAWFGHWIATKLTPWTSPALSWVFG